MDAQTAPTNIALIETPPAPAPAPDSAPAASQESTPAPVAVEPAATPQAAAAPAPAPAPQAAEPPLRMGLLARITGAESAVRELEGRVNALTGERDSLRSQVEALTTERDRLAARANELTELERTLAAEAPNGIQAAIATGVTEAVSTLGVSPEALPAVAPEPPKSSTGNDSLKGLDRVAAAIQASIA